MGARLFKDMPPILCYIMQDQENERRLKKNERQQQYWASHSKDINKRRNERITCSCGMEVSKRHLTEHLNKSKHIKELQKRQTLLEEKTNINIANLISSCLI